MRHYWSTHGHLFRLLETEFDYKWEYWSIPMKLANLHKFAAEKQKALEAHKELVRNHHEENNEYHGKLNQYHMDLVRHQAMLQLATIQAYNDNDETMFAQAVAQIAGAPYQRPNLLANLPPKPVATQAPAPLPLLPPPLKPKENPN